MPQTSIQVPYNRKIHFIWWGNPAGNPRYKAAAIDGPNELAQQIDKQSSWAINYWYQQEHHGFFDQVLHPEIVRRPIADRNVLAASDLTVAEQSEFRDDHPDMVASLPRVMQGLTHFNAYSAVVDLLQMVVLYMEGGYYFDTTVYVPDSDVFLIELATEKISPRLIEQGGSKSAGFENYLNAARQQSSQEFHVPNFDYWVLYSKPGEKIVASMVKNYLMRCFYGRICDDGALIKNEYLKRGSSPDRLTDEVVGRLVAHSVWEGLYFAKRDLLGLNGNEDKEANNAIFRAMMEHTWPLMTMGPGYEFLIYLYTDLNAELAEINDALLFRSITISKFCEARQYKFEYGENGIMPRREFIYDILANSDLADQADDLIEHMDTNEFVILSRLSQASEAQRIDSLRVGRRKALHAYYHRVSSPGVFFMDNFLKKFNILNEEDFEREMRHLAPRPTDRSISSWHHRYKMFKYNASTWRVG